MLLSVVIPIHNEEGNIQSIIDDLIQKLDQAEIPFELILVDDCSVDQSWVLMQQMAASDLRIKLGQRTNPPGFGRAIRTGLKYACGDIITIVMADSSDSPEDVITCYLKIKEGYDCVFGSRFIEGSIVKDYPPLKLYVNRIVNKTLQVIFLTKHNDLTNAFKMYRRYVIETCGPFQSCHFNITLELSLSALIRNYHIAMVPIHWYGRKWGNSKLSLWQMGRKYLAVVIKIFCERMLISDDLIADKIKVYNQHHQHYGEIEKRVQKLEEKVFE